MKIDVIVIKRNKNGSTIKGYISLLIVPLPLRLHSPFSKSNIQFPLQPWLSKLLFEFGQYVQLGYNISPPQDTVTEYQGSIDFDRL